MRIGHDLPDGDAAEIAEINVTPLIDVMLVLLVVFMVAAPLSAVELAVELPAVRSAVSTPPESPVSLDLAADLTLSVDGRPVAWEALGTALAVATQGRSDRRILLRSDRSVAYGVLMRLMGEVTAAGYRRIGLAGVADPGGQVPR